MRSCFFGLVLACAALAATASEPVHLGVATCAASMCHGSALPLPTPGVRQDEYVTWSHFDPHSSAYTALLGERARLITRRLGTQRADTASECLICHADFVVPAQRGERFQLSDGIGCEACHGAAERWLAIHDDRPQVAHADNLRAGMLALDQPRVRAERCLNCHLGGADRFATHRLMAAGHPRLSFELDTYTELWRTSGGHEHYRPASERTRAKVAPDSANVWVTGLIVRAERQLALLESPAFRSQGSLPDFAFFDCYACHKAMGLRRWQERSVDRGGEPGALRLDDTVFRLLALTASSLRSPEAQALSQGVATLQAVISRDQTALPTAIEEVRNSLRRFEHGDTTRQFDSRTRKMLLQRLAQAGVDGEYADYAAAEQLAMAMTVLAGGLGEEGGVPSSELDSVFNALADDDHYDRRQFVQSLRSLLESGR